MSAPNPLARQDTLEAQRSPVTLGTASNLLVGSPTLDRLEKLPQKNAKKIAESLVWYTTFTSSTLTCNEHKAFEFDEKSIFSACMNDLSTILELGPTNCVHVQLCAIATEPDKQILSQIYSSYQKFSAVLRRRTEFLNNVPRRSILARLGTAWKLPRQILDHLKYNRSQGKASWTMNMPSSAQSKKPNLLTEGAQLSLTWQHEAPKFKSDIDIYIWQKDQQPPIFQYADLFVLSNPTDQVQRLLVSFKSTQMLERFSSLRLDEEFQSHGIEPGHSWSPISELLLSIIAVYMQMIEETGIFIQDLKSQINDMKFLGRRDPTRSKFHYLVHIEDCRKAAVQSMVDSLSLIAGISTSVRDLQSLQPSWDSGPQFAERLQEMKRDLIYLKRELDDARIGIEQLQLMIQDYLKLRQDRRVFILTIVAALYIPFTVVSGFFGMNITDTSPPDFSGLDNFTNATINQLPIVTYNQTAALLTALNNNRGYTWEMKKYWIVAIALLCTIPLSITAGGIFRWSIRFGTQHVAYWRVMVILIGISTIVSLYGISPMFDDRDLDDNDIGWLVSIALHSVVLGIFALWRLYHAYHNKQGRRVWTGFFFVLCICSTFYFLTLWYWFPRTIPLILIPWVYLLLIWAGSDIKRWWGDKGQKFKPRLFTGTR